MRWKICRGGGEPIYIMRRVQQLRLVRFSYMTTFLSRKGQVVLPVAVREQLRLTRGDHFEVSIEDDDTIVSRRESHPANRGLIEHLLGCPFPFIVLECERDDTFPTGTREH